MFYSYTSLESETLLGNYITCIRHSQMCTCAYTCESYKCTSTTFRISRWYWHVNLQKSVIYFLINHIIISRTLGGVWLNCSQCVVVFVLEQPRVNNSSEGNNWLMTGPDYQLEKYSSWEGILVVKKRYWLFKVSIIFTQKGPGGSMS